MIFFSKEILYHYHCDYCDKWWSISDLEPRSRLTSFCPHCGVCQSIVEKGEVKNNDYN